MRTMTYGRVRCAAHVHDPTDGRKSLAELVRGSYFRWEGPLIRPFGPPSPQGEKGRLRRALQPTAAGGRLLSSDSLGVACIPTFSNLAGHADVAVVCAGTTTQRAIGFATQGSSDWRPGPAS